MNTQYNPYAPQAPKTEGLAIFSLVLGVLSFFCSIFTGIPAIICGHISRARISGSNGALTGGGIAMVGLLTGYLSLLLTLALVALVAGLGNKFPAAQRFMAAPTVKAVSPQIAIACNQYRADNGKFPVATPTAGEQVNADELFAILTKTDANGKRYYNMDGAGFHVNGTPRDPWGEVLQVALDLDGDGKVDLNGTLVDGSVLVWSKGENKQNEFGGGDDVKSW